jgi:ATP-dependent protease ClpP protease subunit
MSRLINGGVIVLSGVCMAENFDGGFPHYSATDVREALTEFDGDVTVTMNSRGGDPCIAEEIRMMLKEHPGEVTIKINGDCSSAASLLAMGGDTILISRGSTMMIHNPSRMTFGNAAAHQRSIMHLSALADTYAGVYAERTGKPVEEIRAMMEEETWLTSSAAVEAGFATAISDGDASVDGALMISEAKARFGQFLEMCAPSADGAVKEIGGGEGLRANIGEIHMKNENTQAAAPQDAGAASGPADVSMSAIDLQAAIAAERERSTAIMSAAEPFIEGGQVSRDAVVEMVKDGVTVEAASTQILQMVATAQANTQTTSQRRPADPRRDRQDEVATRRVGLSMALEARLMGEDPTDERARPYADLAMHEIAAVSMGRELPRYGSYASREGILMSAMHSTSDFPNLLSGALNRTFERQVADAERTFAGFGREMEFNDFRAHSVLRADRFPGLQKIRETGEIEMGTFGDEGESLSIGSYASGVVISRQAMVNDDLGAIRDVMSTAAGVIPDFEEALFWGVFLSNPKLSDGTALFHADHGNLAASATAITQAALSAGRKALRTQKGGSKNDQKIVANAPALLIVGPEKETEAQAILTAIQATKTGDVNVFNNSLELIVTQEITDNSWFLSVDPMKRTHAMKYGYLKGRKAARIRVDEPFGRQGTAMTIEHDFGAGAVNYRGVYKNAGA